MSDELERTVRTMAGWIGVEISKSRVRTPGKAGYGLWRVRGSFPVLWSIQRGEVDSTPGQGQPTLWTPYAFTLSGIEMAVRQAIRWGTHSGPAPLKLAYGPMPDPTCVDVPTRWTSAYRGRRDLGATADLSSLGKKLMDQGTPPPTYVPAGLQGVVSTAANMEADLAALERTDPAVGAASARLDETVCEIVERSTVRSRQREQNAAFQAEHLRRRAYGLGQRQRNKLKRKAIGTDEA